MNNIVYFTYFSESWLWLSAGLDLHSVLSVSRVLFGVCHLFYVHNVKNTRLIFECLSERLTWSTFDTKSCVEFSFRLNIILLSLSSRVFYRCLHASWMSLRWILSRFFELVVSYEGGLAGQSRMINLMSFVVHPIKENNEGIPVVHHRCCIVTNRSGDAWTFNGMEEPDTRKSPSRLFNVRIFKLRLWNRHQRKIRAIGLLVLLLIQTIERMSLWWTWLWCYDLCLEMRSLMERCRALQGRKNCWRWRVLVGPSLSKTPVDSERNGTMFELLFHWMSGWWHLQRPSASATIR